MMRMPEVCTGITRPLISVVEINLQILYLVKVIQNFIFIQICVILIFFSNFSKRFFLTKVLLL